VLYKDGNYELTNFDLSNHYEVSQLLHIGKFRPKRPVSLIYYHDKEKAYMIKRFFIETLTQNKKFLCIPEGDKNRVVMATDQQSPAVVLERKGSNKKANTEDTINLADFIEIKGWKTIGNKFAEKDFVSVVLLPPDPETEIEEEVRNDLQPDHKQMLLVNDDMLREEEERVKRLLADEAEEKSDKPKRIKKPGGAKPDAEQPKLF
jgi:topoisomerase-4 subunit A